MAIDAIRKRGSSELETCDDDDDDKDMKCRGGGTGRRWGLKIPWPLGREGSNPSRGTISCFAKHVVAEANLSGL